MRASRWSQLRDLIDPKLHTWYVVRDNASTKCYSSNLAEKNVGGRFLSELSSLPGVGTGLCAFLSHRKLLPEEALTLTRPRCFLVYVSSEGTLFYLCAMTTRRTRCHRQDVMDRVSQTIMSQTGCHRAPHTRVVYPLFEKKVDKAGSDCVRYE